MSKALSTLLAVCALLPSTALAADVTTAAARKATLLEYVISRPDLTPSERKAWDKALRLELGGQAIKDGSDEGVTAAKSVVAAAIFFGIEPKAGAKAARDAYHDVYRFVPPPIAINYQVLSFSGKTPQWNPRQMAFDFPRHFDGDIAPDLVRWWVEALDKGSVPPDDRNNTIEALRETRKLMRPMLRDELWRGAELEARRTVASGQEARDLDKAILDLAYTLQRDYDGVAKDPIVLDPTVSFHRRYGIVCAELGERPKARPEAAPRPVAPVPQFVEPAAPPATTPEAPPATQVRPTTPSTPSPRLSTPLVAPSVPLPPAPATAAGLSSPPPGWSHPLESSVNSWIGTPYLWGGESHRGIDCSAFVRQVYREAVGYDLPRVAGPQAELGVPVQQKDLKPGDLVFFDTMERGRITHVAVYVGNGQIAHASSSKGVTRADLSLPYYQHAFWSARRLLKQ